MKEYSSGDSILHTSLSITFEEEKATDLSGLTREVFSIFFKDIQEKYFDGNLECVPRVDPQTCQSISFSDDTMFTTMGKNIFTLLHSHWDVSHILLPEHLYSRSF